METEGGLQLFETQKRGGGHEKWAVRRGGGHGNISPWSCRGSPTEENGRFLFCKKKLRRNRRVE